MAYHKWFKEYFKEKHKNSTIEETLDDVFLMLDSRGKEFLEYNNEFYSQLYIDPNEDILTSKPQIIQQVREELYDFLFLLKHKNVKKILQIGLGHFGSTQFCLNLLFDEVVTVEYDIKNISNYVDREILYDQNVETFIYGDSTKHQTVENVFNHGKFDCVFIDGNHSYEYVKQDHDNYNMFVKNGGIVAFHDAFLEGDRYGTPRVLSEIKTELNVNVIYIIHSKEVGIAYYIK